MSSSLLTMLLGPQFVGILLNWGLLGALSVQVYLYYVSFPQDSRIQKCAIYALCIYEWVQTVLITKEGFTRFVYGAENLIDEVFPSGDNSWFSFVLMAALISGVVQVFYSYRIFKMSGSRILSGIIVLIALGQSSAGVVGASGYRKLETPEGSVETSNLIIYSRGVVVWLSGSAFLDFVIAISMVICLRRFSIDNGRGKVVINRLITMVIETGSMTAVAAFVTLGLFLGSGTQVFICPLLVLSKLYANSVLISFNNRAFIKREMDRVSLAGPLSRFNNLELTTESPSHQGDHNVGPCSPIIVTVLHESRTDGNSDIVMGGNDSFGEKHETSKSLMPDV